MEKQVGHVTHYFSHLGVAVLELTDGLQTGDTVLFRGHHTNLIQTIESMEVNHRKVLSVGPGADVGLKVADHVRPGDAVYKILTPISATAEVF